MTKAFLMLEAERVESGPVLVTGVQVQQEIRLYQAGQCACVVLVNFPAGSPAWEQAMAARETQPPVNVNSVASDAGAAQ